MFGTDLQFPSDRRIPLEPPWDVDIGVEKKKEKKKWSPFQGAPLRIRDPDCTDSQMCCFVPSFLYGLTKRAFLYRPLVLVL